MIEIPVNATAFRIVFTIHDPISGELCDADSTPSASFYYEGAPLTAAVSGVEFSWTVERQSLGVYAICLDMTTASADLGLAFTVTPVVTAIVSGIAQAAPLEPFHAGPRRGYGECTGAGTATTFPVGSTTFGASADCIKGSLITFIDGALAGQVREITAYSGAAAYTITVGSAFTAAPASGNRFLVVFR